MKKIQIDGVDYVPASSVPGPPSEVRIVVVDGCWNLVGRTAVDVEAAYLVMTDASVIRHWGTTAGLGELAAGGPTSETKLDPCHGTVRIPLARVVWTLDTDAALWGM